MFLVVGEKLEGSDESFGLLGSRGDAAYVVLIEIVD
jgi:hypothetical protein